MKPNQVRETALNTLWNLDSVERIQRSIGDACVGSAKGTVMVLVRLRVKINLRF